MNLKKVFTIIAMLLIVYLAGCNKKDDITGVRPEVVSTNPISDATNSAIGSRISAVFSEAMNPSTISATSFTVMNGTTAVTGVVTYSGTTATFTPAVNLLTATSYSGKITVAAANAAGLGLANDYNWSFTTGGVPDITKPTVTLTDPVNNATGVLLNKAIVVTFSKAMDAATVTSLTYLLADGTNSVSGTVTNTTTAATFTPTDGLAYGKTYTGTVTTGVKDLAGNALAVNYTFSFTALPAPDIALPMVNATDPLNNATGIVAGKVVTLTFSEPMTASTINNTTFTLKQGLALTPVAGVVTYAGLIGSFTPTSALEANTDYYATITIGAKDMAGNALAANTVWSFKTGVAPTVSSVDPLDIATGVLISKVVTATFSMSMNQATLTSTTFTLAHGTTLVAGAVTYSGSTASFTPTSTLLPNILYTATVTTGAKNASGFPLASNKVWSFTTAAPLAVAGVNLGTAANYVIFSNIAINNPNANSTITGNIGTGPGVTSTAITGFALNLVAGSPYSTSSQVVGGGKVYAYDYASPTPVDVNTASLDMLTAYNTAVGMAPSYTELHAGDLSGKTLTQGIYKWSNSVVVNTDVTLSGSATDVWIFQISGDLNLAAGGTLPAGVKVVLSGGALAANVYWLVGGPTGATLGTYSTFNGIILSAKAIILNTGAVLNGKSLAQTAVSLDANAVQP
jgi:hypothetical protein